MRMFFVHLRIAPPLCQWRIYTGAPQAELRDTLDHFKED